MGIHQNFLFLLITIWRFTYYYGSLIYRFIKELLPFLTLNVLSYTQFLHFDHHQIHQFLVVKNENGKTILIFKIFSCIIIELLVMN